MKVYTKKQQKLAALVLKKMIQYAKDFDCIQDYLMNSEFTRCVCTDKSYEGIRISNIKKNCKCGRPEKEVQEILCLIQKNAALMVTMVQPLRLVK